VKPLARVGRSLAALPLPLLLALSLTVRSTEVHDSAASGVLPWQPSAATTPAVESTAALTAADGPRDQAVRHTGEAASSAAPAEAPPPRRGVATHAAKPAHSPSQRDRSRVRAAVESRAGVALTLAFAASGAVCTHTTALPPPNA
jgi:hypothetical protein